jgi:hypothetical protein
MGKRAKATLCLPSVCSRCARYWRCLGKLTLDHELTCERIPAS